MLNTFRRTKIVATLGPATSSSDMVGRLVGVGVDVFRLNCSHGSQEERARLIALIREAAERARRPVAVLVDLQGPRIRVGDLPKPMPLEENTEVVFAPEAEAAPGDIPTTYAELADDVAPGARILLNDGLLVTSVVGVEGRRVRARVVHGGVLQSRKGINLPGVNVSAPPLTEKDIDDANHAREHGAEYVGLSFVRRAEDVEALRDLLPKPTGLIAKIEKDTALRDIQRIVQTADGIMVARGDLGVELPFEQVPLVQKQLINTANAHGKPVITATQMLESMVGSPRPTRAEASDVANAILDGTDAVMLSAETAVGTYPLEAVGAMDRIIRSVETQVHLADQPRRLFPGGVKIEDAIASATTSAARMLQVPVIVSLTTGGFTARKVAAHRPHVPILALTIREDTYRRLALVWGVIPQLVKSTQGYDAMVDQARRLILDKGYATAGDCVVVTAGTPWEVSGTTNLLKVEII